MPKIKYQDIKLGQKSLDLIAVCNQIIREYTAAGYVLTLRQLYYQCVSRDIIPNKQSEYKRLGSIVNDGRLAGLIDWSMLEDRTRNVKSISHWDSPEQIIRAVANQYAIDKWDTQDVRPEVWIEKDALVGVVKRICDELDVEYFSCRGYVSQSEMWEAAQRFIQRAQKGQKTHIIHLGDHDPSGIDMSRDIEDRIRMFMDYEGFGDSHFEVSRIALNMDQIQQYNPPPNPAKSTDSRFQGYQDQHGDDSWELDALEPRVLSDLIRGKVAEIRDDEAYEERKDEEDNQKKQLETVSDHWDAVTSWERTKTMSNLTDQELIDAYASGLSCHRITKLVMRGEKFAIFRIPGHRFMNGQLSQYGRSDHTLIRQGESWSRGKHIKVWEGRVSKKELRKALDEAEATLEGTTK